MIFAAASQPPQSVDNTVKISQTPGVQYDAWFKQAFNPLQTRQEQYETWYNKAQDLVALLPQTDTKTQIDLSLLLRGIWSLAQGAYDLKMLSDQVISLRKENDAVRKKMKLASSETEWTEQLDVLHYTLHHAIDTASDVNRLNWGLQSSLPE